MNQVPVLPLRPVLVQRHRRSASIWPDRAPPSPRRRAMATPASLSPGPDPGRRAPPQHRCASALAAAARPGGGSSSWAPARERPRSCTSSRRSRLRRSWRPRSRETWLGIGRRYLRNIFRRLRAKHRSVGKGSLTSSMAAVDDDTARERTEAVARAISYCKDTLRRSSMPPPPSPSPSLDDWLLDDRDRQEVKIIASAAEQHCDDCRTRDSRPSPTRSRRDQDAGWPIRVQTMAKRFKESPCSSSPSRYRDGSLAATAAVAHGEESPHHGHDCRVEPMSSLDELEFLKTFDGDEEMINRHFITVEIPRSGSRAVRKQSPLDMKTKRLDMKRKIRVSVVEPTMNVFQELELELENQSA